jgi:hypothetical protein
VPLRGSLLLLYGSAVFYLAALVGLGLFISSLSATQQQAILGAFLVMVPATLLSGFATPIDNMPAWLQPVTLIDPLRYFLVIVRGVFLKSAPLSEVVAGKRSYVIQYRAAGRSRRYTIGLHGVWTPETARQEAKVQFGRVAQGDNPAEERQLDQKAITVKELCTLYLNDLNAGLILGKGGRPKKPTTIITDTGRIERHIIPLLGTRRVKDLTKADINKVLKDIMAGKTRVSVKTKKLRGKAIVRGGVGTATRTVGLLGGILTYAVEAGIITTNPAHGLRKPKDNVRTRRLTEAEYRTLGEMLRTAEKEEKYATTVEIIRQIALTGCRRSEMIGLLWTEADTDGSCLRLINSKEGTSIRPIGIPVVEFLEARRRKRTGSYVFPGYGEDNAFGSFPNHWEQLFKNS